MDWFRQIDAAAGRANRKLATVAFFLALFVFGLAMARLEQHYPGLFLAGFGAAAGTVPYD